MSHSPKEMDERIMSFLDAYRRRGRLNASAREAGVTPATVYRWRKTVEGFEEAFLEAKEDVVEVLEDTAFDLAVDGVLEERMDKDGNVIARKRTYATNVLLRLLEANAPEKYRQRSETQLGGIPGGEPIQMGDSEAAARLAAILATARERKAEADSQTAEDDPFS